MGNLEKHITEVEQHVSHTICQVLLPTKGIPRIDSGFKGNDSPSSLTLLFVLSSSKRIKHRRSSASSDLLAIGGTWGMRDPASLHPDGRIWS
jgi:hypothetical protein